MARKETVTKQNILEGAFRLAQEQGYGEVSARKIAIKVGCSTQPIFRIYKNMSELQMELFDKANTHFASYYEQYQGEEELPFVNLGMAYISYAQKEANLFKMLFLIENPEGKSMYDLINGGEKCFVMKEIKKIDSKHSKSSSELFMKIWIFIHGVACMVLSNDFDLSEKELTTLLKDAYLAFAG